MTKTIAVLIGIIFVQIGPVSWCAVAGLSRGKNSLADILARIERQSAGDLYST